MDIMLNINDKKISIWYLSNECTIKWICIKKKFIIKKITYKSILNEWKLYTLQCNLKFYVTSKLI